jgi:phosphoglycolate phosphatase-like HAD superfamily hydrolase
MTEPGSGRPGPLRCLILDFDGVLVASNAAKRDAYFQIFRPLGDLDGAIRAALADPSCVDRHDVIARVLESVPPERRASPSALSEQYQQLCFQAQGRGPECPGASALLPRWAARWQLYLNSATPEAPLREAVAARGWTPHFLGVYGRPGDKVANIQRALDAAGARPGEGMMVGDSRGDLEAARRAGCRFVGVRSDGNDFVEPVPMVASLADLDRLLDDDSKESL